MDETASILIATFRRNLLLDFNLASLCRQSVECEVVILDDCHRSDDGCIRLVEKYKDRLDIRYIHTGSTKKANYWRVPGFAFNIGAKQVDSNFILLCCSETYHQNNTVDLILEPLRARKSGIMSIPRGKYDRSGSIVDKLKKNMDIPNSLYKTMRERLNTKYPFLMGLSREDFMTIGGYDEDFTGIAAEDRDLVERLSSYGCSYVQTGARIIHLKHSKDRIDNRSANSNIDARKRFNQRLYQERKGKIFRNQNREWGIL